MEIIIEELKSNEIDQFIDLVKNVFDEFVGIDYSDEGKKSFKDYLKPENYLERLKSENHKFYIAKSDSKIVGVLETRNNDHISLFFVDKEYHNKGIGKKLFEHYLSKLKLENIEVNAITVNSSIYAENIYSRLGFVKTGELQEKNGIKFIPMECKINN